MESGYGDQPYMKTAARYAAAKGLSVAMAIVGVAGAGGFEAVPVRVAVSKPIPKPDSSGSAGGDQHLFHAGKQASRQVITTSG